MSANHLNDREDLADIRECEPLDSDIYGTQDTEESDVITYAEPEQKKPLVSRRTLIAGLLVAVTAAGVADRLLSRDKGPVGTEVLNEYDRISGIKDFSKRPSLTVEQKKNMQLHILKQVAAKNMPDTYDDFVTIEAKGQRGTVVHFKAAPHGLRIGHNDDWIEFPLDGPYSMAAAEIRGFQLPTTWMARAIAEQAMDFKKAGVNCQTWKDDKAQEGKGKVKFYDNAEIAKSLGIKKWDPNNPDGNWMDSPQFIRERNKLLHRWLSDHKIAKDQLIGGYFKEVCSPSLPENGLDFVGGYFDSGSLVNPPSGGKHTADYYDSTHNVRFIESDKLEVTESGGETKTMTIDEFHSTQKFAEEFCFDMTHILKRAYPYYPELAKWMKDNGYLREAYDSEADKEEKANKDQKDAEAPKE